MGLSIPTSAWVAIAIFWAICGVAVWRGGREERTAGSALALAVLATPFLKDHRWLAPQWAVFGVDLLLLLLFGAIAMRTRRWWPIFAAAFQLLGVLTHTARMVDQSVGGWAYVTASVVWSYAVLAAIGVGAINAWRERRHPAGGDGVAEPRALPR